MPKITIITPTIRPEGCFLVEKALKRQTFRDFEWLIVSPHQISFPNSKWIEELKKEEGDVWTLNKAYNEVVRHASGELIISWQDFTFAGPDTLARFAFHFENNPNYLVGAVGNKYEKDDWLVMTWKDPRERSDQGSFYRCYPSDIEWNLCSCPKKALYDIGGFDEYLDKWYGMDGFSVNNRLELLGGYDFWLDQTIKSFSLEHPRPPKWEEKNAIHGPYQERKTAYLANPVLPYLK